MCLQKYREKVPYLSYDKKVDSINNVFVPEENSHFPEIIRFIIFGFMDLLFFQWRWILLFPLVFVCL